MPFGRESITPMYWHCVPTWVLSASFCGNLARLYRVQIFAEVWRMIYEFEIIPDPDEIDLCKEN